jgi:hypothetical protein
MIKVTFNVIITIQNLIQIHQSVQKVHPPQKFTCLPLWNSWSYEIKEYGIEAALNIITSIQNFIQIHELVQKLYHLRSLNVRHFGVIDISFNVITSEQNFIQIHLLVQKLQSPQKFKHPPLWNGWSYEINSKELR